MGGQHDARVQARQRGEQVGDPGGVEPSRRLVEEQHVRPHRHRPRQRHALAFAEAQLVRGAGGEVRDAEQREGLIGAGAGVVVAESEVKRAERDVLGDIGGEELVVRVLQHQLDASTVRPQRGPRVGERLSVEGDPAVGGAQRPGQALEQRGLARAVGAEQRHPSPGGDGEARPRQHRRPARIPDDDPLCPQHHATAQQASQMPTTRAAPAPRPQPPARPTGRSVGSDSS